MLISNPLKRLQKISYEKCYNRKRDRKMEFLTLIFACKSFRPMPFFGDFLRFMIPISNFLKSILLILAHFANFKAKIGRNGSKKWKTYFINVPWNLFWHLSPVWKDPFFSKKSKSLYPNLQCQQRGKLTTGVTYYQWKLTVDRNIIQTEHALGLKWSK